MRACVCAGMCVCGHVCVRACVCVCGANLDVPLHVVLALEELAAVLALVGLLDGVRDAVLLEL